MSELINKQHRDFRRQLLIGVSALSLLVSVAAISEAVAEDSSRPTVWVELGGQLERIEGTGEIFSAPFMTLEPTPLPYLKASPLDAQRAPRFAVGEEAKLTFEPEGTNWVFSAAVRYGRSNGNKLVKHQTNIYGPHGQFGPGCYPSSCIPAMTSANGTAARLVKTFAKHNESHAVLDFMAGKDVGLGLFGNRGRAVVSMGVRYAQFSAKSDVKVYARPNVEFYNFFTTSDFYIFNVSKFNEYTMFANSQRSFHGVGPSFKLDASIPLAGNADGASFAFDWGVNGAILFGRQRATTHHQTMASGYRARNKYQKYTQLYAPPPNDSSRSHSVVVPNIGGFAGLSLNFPNAKVSVGYRGDFFFGATDIGIDARKQDKLSFYGPFATISVGLGG